MKASSNEKSHRNNRSKVLDIEGCSGNVLKLLSWCYSYLKKWIFRSHSNGVLRGKLPFMKQLIFLKCIISYRIFTLVCSLGTWGCIWTTFRERAKKQDSLQNCTQEVDDKIIKRKKVESIKITTRKHPKKQVGSRKKEPNGIEYRDDVMHWTSPSIRKDSVSKDTVCVC